MNTNMRVASAAIMLAGSIYAADAQNVNQSSAEDATKILSTRS